jgi:hypothetical protein
MSFDREICLCMYVHLRALVCVIVCVHRLPRNSENRITTLYLSLCGWWLIYYSTPRI